MRLFTDQELKDLGVPEEEIEFFNLVDFSAAVFLLVLLLSFLVLLFKMTT